jgi:hypothetical protein
MLRYSEGDSEVGTSNVFGDQQLLCDVKADEIVFKHLRSFVKFALSEEQPFLQQMGGEDFIVTFDPLDGSSIISVIYYTFWFSPITINQLYLFIVQFQCRKYFWNLEVRHKQLVGLNLQGKSGRSCFLFVWVQNYNNNGKRTELD